MKEANRLEKYKKNPYREELLHQLNSLLADIEKTMIEKFKKPILPIIFIVGAPRSGTTLLAQALSTLDAFGYVDNFTARFWEVPRLGAELGLALNIRQKSQKTNFKSSLGITRGWHEPHEFGYFWQRWFKFKETHKIEPQVLANIDTDTLQKEIAALEDVYQKPLFFKNLTCSLQISFLSSIFENSLFIHCKREPIYNMQSLLLCREKTYGDRKVWFSLRPKEYPNLKSLNPYEQVAGQLYFILRDIEKSFKNLSYNRKLIIDYETFCKDPKYEISRIINFIRKHQVSINESINQIPAKFNTTNIQLLNDEHFDSLLKSSFKYFKEN